MSLLLALFRPVARPLLTAVLLGFLAVAAALGLQGTGAYLLSRAALHPASILLLFVPIVGVRFFSLLRATSRYGERLVAHDVTLRLLAEVKVRAFQALASQPRPAVVRRGSGAWLRRLSADVDRLQNVYVDAVGPLLVLLLVLALILFLFARFGAAVAGTALVGLMTAGVVVPVVGLGLQRRAQVAEARLEEGVAVALVESVEGMEDLALTPLGGRVREELLTRNEALAAGRRTLERIAALLSALTLFLAGATGLAECFVLAPLVADGRLAGVDVAAVVLSTVAAFEALAPLTRAFATLAEDIAVASRLLVPARPITAASAQPRGFELEVTELSFRYDVNAPWVLSDCSFTLPEGTHVLLTGSSGSGKTTLLLLLSRLLRHETGTIRVGGEDIGRLAEETLRRLVVLIEQRPHVFATTLRQNLLLAKPEADEAELREAIRSAGLAPLVASLPAGLDTRLGEDGYRLSGGERRRLALARAFLSPAPILLLDEPWTGLDPVTARRVAARLREFARGRTMIVVQHEPLLGDSPDLVWRLEDGRLLIGAE